MPRRLILKSLIKKYKHAWVFIYFPIYLVWFLHLEEASIKNYTSIHIALDDYVPFNEWFIIPYYIWFIFIIMLVAFLFFNDMKEFYRCTAFLFIGMTICLFIYTIWPNGQDLRPDLSTIDRDNFALKIVHFLYNTDSYTNVCPSIHVFNSIGVCVGIFHTEKLKHKKYITIPSTILAVLICLSTVFLKQHSVFDIICAFGLAIIMYLIVYIPDYKKIYHSIKQNKAEKYKVSSDEAGK